jgi:oxygen-independent coproporphyrinogen-3 oxidase
MARPFGVYVHFPYCAHRCPYCDFAVTTEPVPGERRYARAVLAELALRAQAFDGLSPASVYLGGGTPSLWDPDEVAEVLGAIRARFRVPARAEVTIEVNPESCDRGRLRALRSAGVSRVSVGAQSRSGRPRQARPPSRPRAAERAIGAAADEIGSASVDLIYGARRSSVAIARADAARAAAAGAVHVSAYQLTLDQDLLAEDVPLARMRRAGRLPLPSDDDAARQGAAIRSALRRAGLRRYEISNYARPGYESVHNRLYWEGESYLGLGAGAYGCLRGEAGALRYGNVRDAGKYAEAALAGLLPTVEEDRIEPRANRNERLMLALRTLRGMPLGALSAAQAREADEAVRRRLAVRRGGRLVLTSRGMDLHSALSERLFE